LNWGALLFALGAYVICVFVYYNKSWKPRLSRTIKIVAVVSMILAGLGYLTLPKIEVKLVKGRFYSYLLEEQLVLQMVLNDGGWQTIAEARKQLQNVVVNPTEARRWGLESVTNYWVGGQIHEEDSPGNYVLRETNSQLRLVTFDAVGLEVVSDTWDLPHK